MDAVQPNDSTWWFLQGMEAREAGKPKQPGKEVPMQWCRAWVDGWEAADAEIKNPKTNR